MGLNIVFFFFFLISEIFLTDLFLKFFFFPLYIILRQMQNEKSAIIS